MKNVHTDRVLSNYSRLHAAINISSIPDLTQHLFESRTIDVAWGAKGATDPLPSILPYPGVFVL